jgi:hypothetical protein
MKKILSSMRRWFKYLLCAALSVGAMWALSMEDYFTCLLLLQTVVLQAVFIFMSRSRDETDALSYRVYMLEKVLVTILSGGKIDAPPPQV